MRFTIRPLLSAFLLLLPAALAAADRTDSFVDALGADERAAIGIDSMTPAQIAALEAAVQRFSSGRKEEAVAAAKESVRSEMSDALDAKEKDLAAAKVQLAESEKRLQASEADEAKPKRSLLDRAAVLLRPGTRIEYTKLESRLAKPFRGWKSGTLFELENGQTWSVVEGSYWSPLEPAGKAVTIEPGTFGSFFIKIEGVKPTPRVVLVGGP